MCIDEQIACLLVCLFASLSVTAVVFFMHACYVQVKDAQNEIRMLKAFNGHPNIIRLLGQSSVPKNSAQVPIS